MLTQQLENYLYKILLKIIKERLVYSSLFSYLKMSIGYVHI